ncbi:MAG: HNH endonuclease [Thermoleophilaceae bacterium]
MIPRSKGGGSSWENIVTCCAPCNRRKGDRLAAPGQHGAPPRTPGPELDRLHPRRCAGDTRRRGSSTWPRRPEDPQAADLGLETTRGAPKGASRQLIWTSTGGHSQATNAWAGGTSPGLPSRRMSGWTPLNGAQ